MVPQPKIAYDIGVSVKGAIVGLFLGSNGLPTDVLQVNVMQQSGVNIGCSAIHRIPKPFQLLCVGNLVGGLFCAVSLCRLVRRICRNSQQSCNFFGIFSGAILYVRQCIDLLLSRAGLTFIGAGRSLGSRGIAASLVMFVFAV